MSADYRDDIDGLRAIAVIAVVIFHAFPAVLPGGYVGVDVFFVISGYLITGIIVGEIERGQFTLAGFYIRRIRRIFPALLLVLAACLGFALSPWFAGDQALLGQHGLAAALFGSNLLLWSEAGYFDSAQHAKPLLHLWSLAVEEQFYLLWPLLLLAAWRWARAWLLPWTLLVATLSWVASLLILPGDPVQAFYSPLLRFWELLAGALLVWSRPTGSLRAATGRALTLLGLAMIGLPMLWLDGDSVFPGWWALCPVVGTLLVIVAGSASTATAVLGQRWLVGLGRISYPWYLWHWPLLSFAWVAQGTAPAVWLRLLLVAAGLLLAWLSYRWVEQPLRRLPPDRAARLAVALLLLLLCIGAFSHMLWQSARHRPAGAPTTYVDPQVWQQEFRRGTCFVDGFQADAEFSPECAGRLPGREADPPRPLVLLWGDSHAASLYRGLVVQAERRGFDLAQYTGSLCPPILGVTIRWRPACDRLNRHVLTQIQALRPHTVVIAAYWSAYRGQNHWPLLDDAQLQQTLAAVRAAGVPQIVLVGHLPVFDFARPVGPATFVAGQVDRNRDHLVPTIRALDDRIGRVARASGVVFLSPLQLLCNERGCLISASPQQLIPLTWDNQHLNAAGSTLLIEAAMQQQMLALPGSLSAGE